MKNNKKYEVYNGNIHKLVLDNSSFRKVIYTSRYLQLVLMNLRPKEDIGLETHDTADQFFKFIFGFGIIVIDKKEHYVGAGDVAIVPMGTMHNIVNTSESEDLKFYTIYSPPEHDDGLVQNFKNL